MRIPIIVSSAATVLAVGCHAGTSVPSTVIRDSAGVTIVENPGTDAVLPWSLDTVATIGGAGTGIDLAHLNGYTVDADSLGHIFALDAWYGSRLQLIDTTGHLVRSLTRQGGGPGEVGQAVAVSASGDGVASLMDFSKMGLVRVDWTGAVLPLIRVVGFELFGGARGVLDTVVIHSFDPATAAAPEHLSYRTDRDTATLLTHTPIRLGSVTFCRGTMEGLTPMLAPEIRWTSRGSVVAANHTADYRVDLFRRGKLVRSIRRTVAPVPGSVAAVTRFFPEGKIVGTKDCVIPPAELVNKRGVASVLQPIRALALDWDGTLWVERNDFPGEPARTDVFDPDGRYLGTLRGIGAPLGFPRKNLIVVARPDSTISEPRLQILRR